MASVYCAILENGASSNYWNGTTAWGYDPDTGEALADQTARDAIYTAVYATSALWESARDGVAGAGDDEYGIIQGTWTALCGNHNIDGWTTGSITLRAVGVARTTGVYTEGPAFWMVGQGSQYQMLLNEPNTTVEGIQFHNTSSGDVTNDNIKCSSTGILVLDCVCNSSDAGNGISVNTPGATVTVVNCVCYNPHGSPGASSEGIYCDNQHSQSSLNSVYRLTNP